MLVKRLLIGFLVSFPALAPVLALADSLTHDMQVVLQPASGRLIVYDRIGFAQPRKEFRFRLNAGLAVEAAGGTLERLDKDPLQPLYRLAWDKPAVEAVLHYAGKPVFSGHRGHGGMPDGDVSADGVYLDGASAWYPLASENLGKVRMRVRAPPAWQALSVGRRSERQGEVVWSSDVTQEDLYLVAGPYTRHSVRSGNIDLSVWLLHDDPALAQRYLSLMGEYIEHYSKLIGAYPYAKFAVVENRWPTGLGMPSFTLLGSQVLRLPFIPYTSLPHEILHNWWGNGVWVDYRKGNWSEGLTAYLADHWMKERQGKGAQYRLQSLQRYSNYAANGRDMPLLDFVSRHDEASQSVGYSKSLMYFHMLRRALGDAAFDAGLRRLWQEYRFKRIGFKQAVRAIVGEHPEVLRRFLPWLQREGAPRLGLLDADVRREGDRSRLEFTLAQTGDRPFDLDIPVQVQFEYGGARRVVEHLDQPLARYALTLDRTPVRLTVDPDYDVLRYLDPSEQPPSLSQLFGGTTWLVLPDAAPAEELAAWRRLAQAWQGRFPQLKVVDDAHTGSIPDGANRLLLGWDNRALDSAMRKTLSTPETTLRADALLAGGQRYARNGSAVVCVATDAAGVSSGFIGADGTTLIDALARKLPHYGSYGVLAFDATSAQNRYKAVPDNPNSRMSRDLK